MKIDLSRACGVLALIIVIVRVDVAQCRGWAALDEPGPPSVNSGVIGLVTWDPDGPGAAPEVLVASGAFNTIGGIPAQNVATWDGVSWQPLGAGTPSSYLLASCVYNGELIVGGLGMCMRWDGSSWIPLGPPGGLIGDLIVYNGELVAVGYFTVGGISARIARWNGSIWQTLGTGTNDGVNVLAVWNGDLIAGGQFTEAGGTAVQHVARWDGSSWFPLGATPSGVSALTVHDGELYAGGFQGGPGYFVARWNGVIWQPIYGLNSTVSSFGHYEGDLVVGGHFTLAGGVACNGIARWNGSTWQPFGLGLVAGTPSDGVDSLANYHGALIAGGQGFQLPDTPPGTYNMVAQWATPFSVHVAQPGGAGSGVFVTNTGLTPGHEYFNIASYEICAGGPGSGPYGGLCFSDLSFLYFQLSFPVGFHPFHFIAGGPTLVVGPYYSNPESYDAICADVTVPSLDCISPVTRFTLQ